MESSTRRQATRQKLYEAAVTLIAEQGFSATTVDEIAERAGVAKGTVYYNFASKSVLFEQLLAAESQSSEDDRLFNLRLAFARHLPPDARLGMLERRRAHLVERLVQLRARVKASRERADGYARSLMEHDRESAEHDLSWIDRLIATERAGGLGEGTRAPASPGPAQPEPERPAEYRGAASPSLKGLRPLAYQEDRTT